MLDIVDSFMIGSLGAESLAVSALANSLFFLIMVLGIGVSHAITALVAIAVGEGNKEHCGIIARQELLVNLVFGAILTAITHFAAQFVKLINPEIQIVDLTISYYDY